MLDGFIVFRGVHEQEQLHRCLDSCTDEQDGQSHGERHIPEDDGQRDDRKDEREEHIPSQDESGTIVSPHDSAKLYAGMQGNTGCRRGDDSGFMIPLQSLKYGMVKLS
ncbi:hypothetical protein J27TS7_07370 [Paenibacillus dendritiformis]|nr:hypothetical protein J27TS7_07370 [Paenibacillus dendritiformis]